MIVSEKADNAYPAGRLNSPCQARCSRTSGALKMAEMYCDQCEQTKGGVACIERGVCGKDADVESLQKVLLYGLKGMAAYKHHARRLGKTAPEVEAFIEEALFATMTNVNFDGNALLELVLECGRMNLKDHATPQ